MWWSISIWCFELVLNCLWMMSRKNNLIYIQTTTIVTATNTSNHSSTEYLYTPNQLWQIKDRVDQDRTLGNIPPEIANSIRKLKLQKRKTRGKRGGTKNTTQYQ